MYAAHNEPQHKEASSTALPLNNLRTYSNEEKYVLQQAASILAIPISKLPSSLQQLHAPPYILSAPSTSATDAAYADNYESFEPADEELLSPFSWHTESVVNSTSSPESAHHGQAHVFVTGAAVQDDLNAFQHGFHNENSPLNLLTSSLMVDLQASANSTTLPWSSSAPDSYLPAPHLTDVPPSMFEWEHTGQPIPAHAHDETVPGIDHDNHTQVLRPTQTPYVLPPSLPHKLPLPAAIDPPSDRRQQPSSDNSVTDVTMFPITHDFVVPEGGPSWSVSDNVDALPSEPLGLDLSGAIPDSFTLRERYQTDMPISNRGPKRRQAFQDLKKRLETGNTRKKGACVRCRLQRIRCLPGDDAREGSCRTCLRLSKPTQANLPCVRYKISDSRLFDKGKHPQFKWSKRWSSWEMVEIETWASAEVKVITVTQDVFGGSTFDIRCREFIPVEGDSLERTWKKDGVTQYYRRAPYAIANMKETARAITRFVATNIGSCIKHYINVKDDRLLQSTYAMAYAMVFQPRRFAGNEEARRMLQEVFQLWVAIRMESQSERICGKETLGMEPQFLDEKCNTYGTNSIPPMMSAQVELITTTRILQPLKRSVLRALQRLIQENKFRNWFPIYLCFFILLHSCSILTLDENRAARKYGLQTRYVYNAFVEELHNGAKTMIYYFHYNNKGSHPFARDWKLAENIEMAELSPEQAQFLVATSKEVKRRQMEFETVRESGDFENDFYFLSQLYDMEWKPTFTI